MPIPCISKMRPKAMADAMPEQKTKISVASEKPKRAGIQLIHQLPGVCETRMMNIATPRKKSSRGSRFLTVELEFSSIVINLYLADDDVKRLVLDGCCEGGLELDSRSHPGALSAKPRRDVLKPAS